MLFPLGSRGPACLPSYRGAISPPEALASEPRPQCFPRKSLGVCLRVLGNCFFFSACREGPTSGLRAWVCCSCGPHEHKVLPLSRAIHGMNTLATRARPRCSGESAGPPLACFEVPAQAADQGAVWVCAIRWGFFLASVEAERQALPREAATAIPAPVEAYVQQHFARWGIEASRKNLLCAGVGRREIAEYFARDARAASNSRSRARAQPRQPPQRQG